MSCYPFSCTQTFLSFMHHFSDPDCVCGKNWEVTFSNCLQCLMCFPLSACDVSFVVFGYQSSIMVRCERSCQFSIQVHFWFRHRWHFLISFNTSFAPHFSLPHKKKPTAQSGGLKKQLSFFIVTKKFSFYLQSMQTWSLYCPYIDAMLPWKILKYLIKKFFSSPPPVVARKEGWFKNM